VALIAAAQRIEHYEIASYGTVRRWAEILGEAEQAALLDKTVQDEGHADQLLTSIAERVNVEADKAA
jgi:ferritin-like metal-binding protein YciE